MNANQKYHYANPANCIDPEPPFNPATFKRSSDWVVLVDPEPPFDPNWKPKAAVINLTDKEPPVDPNFKATGNQVNLQELGPLSGITKYKFAKIQLESID